ncbi:RRP15-like protein isoform X1 [Oncorhynchus keta]|uniref:RRP15-like protein isoform X1 n=1 Tax=Oncorhynchus keta TaxID=8018 RepID=UPI0015FBEBEC|nr:RRP15-like protein isoform X1 [Oncorhynchus keta]XP_035601347.1 RRP15-like protein isoform X1 [Oncorhynchus keta]
MASVEKAHVENSAGILEEPQEDHSAESDDSDRGSDGEGSEDGGSEEEDGESEVEQTADGGSEGEKEEGEGNREVDDVDTNPNAGWAEAMAKILQKKTPESKPSILLKNKQLDKMKEKEKKENLERKKQTDKKRAWEMMCREKPDLVKDRENERNLQRVATRGVVQLFNAVRKHQKTVDEKVKEAGGSERKKAKLLSSVSKKDFINVLRGTEGGSEVVIKTERQTTGREAEEKPAWSVLRDDFMMGASMKDWDKESDEEGDEEEAPGGAEDYNSESD